MPYVIAKPKYSNKSNSYLTPKKVVEWVFCEEFGMHEKSVDAKRSYLFKMKELDSNKEYSDEFIERNMKHFKVKKIK